MSLVGYEMADIIECGQHMNPTCTIYVQTRGPMHEILQGLGARSLGDLPQPSQPRFRLEGCPEGCSAVRSN